MNILRFDLLIITTLLLAFGLILLATQADGAMDFEVKSSQLTTNHMRSGIPLGTNHLQSLSFRTNQS